MISFFSSALLNALPFGSCSRSSLSKNHCHLFTDSKGINPNCKTREFANWIALGIIWHTVKTDKIYYIFHTWRNFQKISSFSVVVSFYLYLHQMYATQKTSFQSFRIFFFYIEKNACCTWQMLQRHFEQFFNMGSVGHRLNSKSKVN